MQAGVDVLSGMEQVDVLHRVVECAADMLESLILLHSQGDITETALEFRYELLPLVERDVVESTVIGRDCLADTSLVSSPFDSLRVFEVLARAEPALHIDMRPSDDGSREVVDARRHEPVLRRFAVLEHRLDDERDVGRDGVVVLHGA